MRRLLSLSVSLTLAVALGCDGSTDPTAPEAIPRLSDRGVGVTASSSGGGHLTVAGVLDVQFAFTAVQTSPDGTATGRAHHSVVLGGELIEFHTRVTCMTVDPQEGRAWIGGVITKNNSTHPGWMGVVHQPGRDIWFRVVDYGEGADAPQLDRSTFVGFEGSAGIITSEEYCDTQPWPASDQRTNPVTEGNLQVRAR